MCFIFLEVVIITFRATKVSGQIEITYIGRSDCVGLVFLCYVVFAWVYLNLMKREFEMIYRGQTKDPIGQHDAGAVGTADRGVSSTAQAVGRVGVRHAGDARRPPRPRHAQNHRETRTIPIVNERKQTTHRHTRLRNDR